VTWGLVVISQSGRRLPAARPEARSRLGCPTAPLNELVLHSLSSVNPNIARARARMQPGWATKIKSFPMAIDVSKYRLDVGSAG